MFDLGSHLRLQQFLCCSQLGKQVLGHLVFREGWLGQAGLEMCPGFDSLRKCCEFARVLLFGVGSCSVSSVSGIVGMSLWEFPLLQVLCNL